MGTGPKHILHLMPYKSIGGTETAALRIAEITRESGYKNTFLCQAGSSLVSSFFSDRGFDVIEFDEIQPSILHPSAYWRGSLKMARKIAEMKIDLIHAQDYFSAAFYSLAAILARKPLISHVRNKHNNVSKRDQFFLRPVKHWIFVSKEARDSFSFKTNAKNGTVIYDGIKIKEINEQEKIDNRKSVFKEFNIQTDTKLIGMIARVAPQKDFFTLADAVKKLSRKYDSIKIIVIGDNAKEENTRQHFKEVSKYINKLGISGKFIFTGYRTDVKRLIDALDVHVLSTNFEGFALVNLEVMARQIPAILTLSGTSLEIIEHGKNGLLFEHKNSGELAQRIEELIINEDLAEKIGTAGFQTVKNKFNHEKFSTEILTFYERMLK
jgi:glycosyltransferase involved in cell wall biosynthesis